MSSGPLARATPGCHSRNTSGERGATMAGSAVNAPRLRSVLARWRASYSFFTGQQKATRLRSSPGNERAIKPSMRSRQESSCAGESAKRAVIKRSRCVFRHVFRATASTRVLSFASMIFKEILGASVALWLAAAPAFAGNSSDDALLGAFDAYRAGDPIKFAKHAQKLSHHVLEPWLEYWRLSLRLEDMPATEVHAFLSKFERTYVAELLREEWLKVLGRRGDWQEFDRQAAFYSRDDLEVRCYGWASRLQRGDESAYAEAAAAMWLEPRELPEGCSKLADAMMEEGQLTLGDVWRRVRVLFENGQITAAKTALGYLPRNEAPDERMLAEAARQPKSLLARLVCACRRLAAHRRAAGLESARGAAPRKLAGGARLDRPDVRRRAAGAGLVLLVRPGACRAGRGDRQPRLLPASCRTARLLWPAGRGRAGLHGRAAR